MGLLILVVMTLTIIIAFHLTFLWLRLGIGLINGFQQQQVNSNPTTTE